MRTPVDLDLFVVRCFLRVAELQHFGWAADELRIAQPTLSRHIQRLERQVGVTLLERGPTGTSVTPAGELLRTRLADVLDEVDAAVSDARSVGDRLALTVGYVGDLVVTEAVRELRKRHPQADVRTVHLGWREVNPALHRHRVDLVVARRPFDEQGLEVLPVRTQGRALLVPRDHRLAGRRSVRLADFADEALVRYGQPEYDAFWRLDPRPDGSPAPDGPLADLRSDKLETVASGEALALAPAAPDLRPPRADLVAIPVDDVDPVVVALAVRSGETLPLAIELQSAELRALL